MTHYNEMRNMILFRRSLSMNFIKLKKQNLPEFHCVLSRKMKIDNQFVINIYMAQ